eukprot:TRINITY_DN354_c0_g1_i1.p5 TRINITY_DN354_c0_g1~~TRINITY_DN354_c0_g1_i1.p5  ORF type:complete len:55 (-),score=11.88 TRINITY_DN354_c0_g1_i1:620-784(-)
MPFQTLDPLTVNWSTGADIFCFDVGFPQETCHSFSFQHFRLLIIRRLRRFRRFF